MYTFQTAQVEISYTYKLSNVHAQIPGCGQISHISTQISLPVHMTSEAFFTFLIHKFNAVFKADGTPGHMGHTRFTGLLETTHMTLSVCHNP